MSNKSKPKRQMCYNCKHASSQFKIGDMTHVQCNHIKNKDESPWGTLREWHNKYDCWEAK